MNNKKIVVDFEFTNKESLKAELLEFCALFVENDKIIDEVHSLIKFEKNWEELKESDITALKFNKINSSEELEKHNKKAKNEREVLEEFLKKSKEFGKFGITGWNNSGADNVILKRVMIKYGYDFDEYFDYHSRDIGVMFRPFYDAFFADKFKLSLMNAHKFLIKSLSDENFHLAKNDCVATLDIDVWLENKMRKLKIE